MVFVSSKAVKGMDLNGLEGLFKNVSKPQKLEKRNGKSAVIQIKEVPRV